MTRLVLSFLFAFLVGWSSMTVPVEAQHYESLFQDFDSRDLTYNERRYLQTALAFEGHYKGLLDGDWGRLSREAMNRYSRREFGSASEEWHMAVLTIGFFDRYKSDGWDMQYFPALYMSVMLPQDALIVDPPTQYFLNYRHATSSLAISVGRHDQGTVSNIHSFTINSHAVAREPYLVRKNSFAVSSATLADGSSLYARSNFINGKWSTILISAQAKDKNSFSAVTSSIAKGRTAKIDITKSGKLMHVVQKALEFASSSSDEQGTRAEASPAPTPKKGGSSGSGFVVSKEGHILTNAHVVKECSEILVDGQPATLVESSDMFDLALLKTSQLGGKEIAVFSASPAKLNSDVTVVGYPYANLLGGLNVTRGSVSSLKGLRGDATTLQITAPVQSGNSGGPLVAADGEVVGVIVSKLDALVMAKNSGDIPQNVNFAIRGEIAKLFLAQNQIEPELSLTDEVLPPEVLASKASRFTTFIQCQ